MVVVRPIETNMSLYNVELKASEVKDPNASQLQAAQQSLTKKDTEHQAQSVQATEQAEGEVKIRDREAKREQERGGGKKKKASASGQIEEPEEEQVADRTPETSRGFNFLA